MSFFTDLGSEIIYPILPLFLRLLGASRTVLGAIEGVAEGLPAFLRLWAGTWSDQRQRRKPPILAGYTLSALTKPLIALARSPGAVFMFRIADRVGKGLRTAPRDALVADLAGRDQRGRAFGFQRAMDHAGALLGGLVSFGLLLAVGSDLTSLRRTILFSAIPGFLAVLTIIFFLPDRPAEATSRTSALNASPSRQPPSLRQRLSRLPNAYFFYILGASCFALGNSSDAFLLLRARDMGISVPLIPLLWALLHAVKSGTSLWGGRFSDRFGRFGILTAGWFLYSGVYVGMALLRGTYAAWMLFAAYGLFFGLTEGASRAVIADLVPPEDRGTAFGLWGTIEGLLLITASIIAGWMWDVTGSGTLPLLLGATLSFVAAAFLALCAWQGLFHEHAKR